MKRRSVVTFTLAAAAVFAAGAVPGASASVHAPVHAMFAKVKMVKLNVRNDSGAPLKLKAGDTSMTIEAGKVMPLKLAEGTSITIEEATAKHEAGSVLTQVSSSLEGATVVVN